MTVYQLPIHWKECADICKKELNEKAKSMSDTERLMKESIMIGLLSCAKDLERAIANTPKQASN